MKEIVRSNDPVYLSWVQAVLAEAGIPTVEFDRHAAVMDGSIMAIQRRLMVADDDLDEARTVLMHAKATPIGELDDSEAGEG